MSTRATYQFEAKHCTTTTIYIHHDGYPEGAADYFYRLLISDARGCMAVRMIRANGGAELTDGHDAHGDTVYRYNIIGTGSEARISALRRKEGTDGSKVHHWECVLGVTLTLGEFVARFKKSKATQ